MSPKKDQKAGKESTREVEADFFGDDPGWLDDPSEEAGHPAPPGFVPNRNIRRPPPMPTLPPTPSMLADLEESGPAKSPVIDERAPKEPIAAPVEISPDLLSRSGPTITAPDDHPPERDAMPMQFARPAPPAPVVAVNLLERQPGDDLPEALPTEIAGRHHPAREEHDLLGPDLPTQEDSTLDVDPDAEARAKPVEGFDTPVQEAAPIAPEPPEHSAFNDDLDEQEDVPLVRTVDSAPARASVTPLSTRERARKGTGEAMFTPPVAPPPPFRPEPAAAPSEPTPPPQNAQHTPTSTPEPARRRAVSPSIGHEAALAPPTTPSQVFAVVEEDTAPLPPMAAPPRPAWTPGGDEQDWRAIARALVADAAVASGDSRARLLLEASRIHRRCLSDEAAADQLLHEAGALAASDPLVFEELALSDAASERWAESGLHLVALARTSTGPDAADAWERAAILYRQRLGKPEEAVGFLNNAVDADPTAYSAWNQLRDVLAELGRDDERVAVLEKLASLSTGRLAADAWWERGRVLQRLKRGPDAAHSFERALEADPSHTPAFLAIEALLESNGNDVGLAALYEAEARRAPTTIGDQGPDRAAFALRAARRYANAHQAGRAETAFKLSIASGSALAHRERQAWLMREGRVEDLAAAIDEELQATSAANARAHLQVRLAVLRERLGDVPGAIALYRAAAEADPTCLGGPVGAALDRLWFADGPWPEVRGVLDAMAASPSDDARRAGIARLALIAENRGEAVVARAAWQQLLDAGDLSALDGVERVARRAGDRDSVVRILEERAASASTPSDRAGFLVQAALGGLVPDGDPSHLERALEAAPTSAHVIGARIAAALGAPDEVDALERSAHEAHGQQRAAVLARVAHLRCDRGEPELAVQAAVEALAGAPASGTVLDLLDRMAARGVAHPAILDGLRARAERCSPSERPWRLLFAWEYTAVVPDADARADLLAILADDPAHPGALYRLGPPGETLSNAAWRRASDQEADPRLRNEVRLRLAEGFSERGDAGAAKGMLETIVPSTPADQAQTPARAASRLAETMQAWALAATLLAASPAPEDRLHEARIAGQRLQDAQRALSILQPLLDDPQWAVAAAAGASAATQRLGDVARTADVNARLAAAVASPPVKGAYASWSATLYEGLDRPEDALAQWRVAYEARPAARSAFEGVRRNLARLGDAAGLRQLHTNRTGDALGLAEALDDANDPGAADAWRAAIDAGAPELPALLRLERACSARDDWAGAYDALARRMRVTQDEGSRGEIDAKRRWILAEKLAATEMAWDLYRQLHDEQPGDRAVTEILARIAAARGETARSIQFLKELADTTQDRVEACRTQRRIAEVYEGSGDVASARQALLDALDHVSDDSEALGGLRRLAEREQDWPALVAVLQREEGLAPAPRRAELRREIARVTQDRITDRAVAIDRWRSVLELQPRDPEALERLLDLAASLGEWSQFVESGQVLAGLLSGAARTALLRRVGIACQVELARDDAARFFEAAIAEEPPDLEAARRLEELSRTRGDWPGAIRCLGLLSRLAEDPAQRVDYLQRAGIAEAEGRHDRAAAAKWYQAVLDIDPSHQGALKFQAEFLFSDESNDVALPVYERLEPYMVSTQDTDDFDTRMELSSYYFRFAELLRNANREDDARIRYERALELNPAHLPTLEAVGPLYMRRQEWKMAEKVYRQVLQLTGGQGDRERVATTYSDLGLVEWHLGSVDKAQKRFAKALELFPNHIGALKGMAMVLDKREDWANLLNVYNNVIYHAAAADDVIAAYLAKGRILDRQMSRPDKAMQHYEGALAIDANQPGTLARLAELSVRKGAWAEAEPVALRGLRAVRDDQPTIRAVLMLIQAGARKAAGTPGVDAVLAEVAAIEPALATVDIADHAAVSAAINERIP